MIAVQPKPLYNMTAAAAHYNYVDPSTKQRHECWYDILCVSLSLCLSLYVSVCVPLRLSLHVALCVSLGTRTRPRTGPRSPCCGTTSPPCRGSQCSLRTWITLSLSTAPVDSFSSVCRGNGRRTFSGSRRCGARQLRTPSGSEAMNSSAMKRCCLAKSCPGYHTYLTDPPLHRLVPIQPHKLPATPTPTRALLAECVYRCAFCSSSLVPYQLLQISLLRPR